MNHETVQQAFHSFSLQEEVLTYKFQCDDLLIWPLIKLQVYKCLISRSSSSVEVTKVNIFDRFKHGFDTWVYYIKSFIFKPASMLDTQVLFIIPSRGFIRDKKRCWYSEMWTPYIELLESSVFQNAWKKNYRFQKNVPYFSYNYVELKAGFLSKYFGSIHSKDSTFIHKLSQHIQVFFKLTDSEIDQVITYALGLSRRLPFLKKEWEKIFKRSTRLKTIFLNAGSYLDNAYVTKWAHDCGIKVVELQHGVVHGSCPTYNQTKDVCNLAVYKRFYPDYILTWGAFWNPCFQLPSRTVSIGNTVVNKYQSLVKKKNNENKAKKKILVFYEQILHDVLKEFADSMAPEPYEIYIKFHPNQDNWHPVKDIEQEFRSFDNVFIETQCHLYDALNNTDIVFGNSSTALYESAAMHIPVFYFEKELIDDRIGDYVETAEQLKKGVLSQKNKAINVDLMDTIFDPNWKTNFTDFCKDELDLIVRYSDTAKM